MQVKKQQLELDMEQLRGSKLGKECVKAVYCQPIHLIYMQSISWNVGLNEAQAGIKSAKKNIHNIYADGNHPNGESKEELKNLLMNVKEKSEKAGWKCNIQKMKIMASNPITLWQIDGETVTDFIFLGSKITADGDCNQDIKRHLLLRRKAMTNLGSVL